MNKTRRYLAGLLALVLVLTSQGYAMARHATGPAGTMVICTGTGPVSVMIDENGQPTGQVHICPDCLAGLYDITAPAPIAHPDIRLRSHSVQAVPRASGAPALWPVRFHARAPPMAA